MAIHITDSKLEGVLKWMLREPWLGHCHEAINDHFHAYFDKHDTDNFDQLDEMIGRHWVTQLNLIAINDILSRETEDGNVTDIYLKKRGWKERAVPKAYLRGIRNSVMSLYEARDVRPGESFMARDLFLDREPFRDMALTMTLKVYSHLICDIWLNRTMQDPATMTEGVCA